MRRIFSRRLRAEGMSAMRGTTKNACPPRSSSFFSKAASRASSDPRPGESAATTDRVPARPGGGSGSSDVSRRPASAAPSVRGMGVADSVSTSTSTHASFSLSFCVTPKRCSSSMTASPRRRHVCRGASKACVPMATSVSPLASEARTRRISLRADPRTGLVPASSSMSDSRPFSSSSSSRPMPDAFAAETSRSTRMPRGPRRRFITA
mmetsp:Transcript_5779/g.18325  ORF Transcript_5779/g.18325 Transcript_5779/m.18325 type:complete len:208 (+) Transcript_5779:1312-1935(+)